VISNISCPHFLVQPICITFVDPGFLLSIVKDSKVLRLSDVTIKRLEKYGKFQDIDDSIITRILDEYEIHLKK
jgi:hypothetical protein